MEANCNPDLRKAEQAGEAQRTPPEHACLVHTVAWVASVTVLWELLAEGKSRQVEVEKAEGPGESFLSHLERGASLTELTFIKHLCLICARFGANCIANIRIFVTSLQALLDKRPLIKK